MADSLDALVGNPRGNVNMHVFGAFAPDPPEQAPSACQTCNKSWSFAAKRLHISHRERAAKGGVAKIANDLCHRPLQ